MREGPDLVLGFSLHLAEHIKYGGLRPPRPMSSHRYDVCMALEKTFLFDSRVLKEGRSLARHGLSVRLLALSDPGADSDESVDGIHVKTVRVGSRRLSGRWATGLKVTEFLIKYTMAALRSRARVYHAHHLLTLLPSAIAAKVHRAKLVYDCHELLIAMPGDPPAKSRLVKWYEGLLLPFVDRVIISDGASRAKAFREAHGYRGVIEYVYNCPVLTEPSHTQRDPRRQLGIDAKNRLVVYTGSMKSSRGLEVAIESMAFWPRDTHFLMIGQRNEEYEKSLMELAEKLQVNDRVHLWGPVPHDDVATWESAADVAVVLIQNTGLSYYYSAPTKMFESIMARVPQVSSDFPEMKRIVVENPVGPVGKLVDPSDPRAVGLAVRELLDDQTLSASYRRNADGLARSICNWQEQERVLFSMYRELMN